MTLGRSAETLMVAGLGALGLFFLVAPMFVILLASLDPGDFFEFPPRSISLHWYRELLGSEDWFTAIEFTLLISALTGIVATLVGGLAGVAVARCPPAARTAMYFLLVAPLTIPTIAIAISIYGVALHLHLIGNLAAFVLANSLITAPLVALFVAAATLNVDRRLEYASLSCGAGPIRTLARITVPLILPTAIAGGGLAFLLTLDEVVISSFLVGPGRTPLAVKLFLHIQTGSTPITTAAATFLIVLSVLIVAALTIFRTLAGRSRVAVRAELGPSAAGYRAHSAPPG